MAVKHYLILLYIFCLILNGLIKTKMLITYKRVRYLPPITSTTTYYIKLSLCVYIIHTICL